MTNENSGLPEGGDVPKITPERAAQIQEGIDWLRGADIVKENEELRKIVEELLPLAEFAYSNSIYWEKWREIHNRAKAAIHSATPPDPPRHE